jgi:hypothetical protein
LFLIRCSVIRSAPFIRAMLSLPLFCGIHGGLRDRRISLPGANTTISTGVQHYERRRARPARVVATGPLFCPGAKA